MTRVHPQDGLATDPVGPVDHNLAVEAAGAEERRVEHIRAVGGREHNDGLMRVKAIHLDEDLVEGLFALIVASSKARATLAPDGIEFIDEDDTRGAFLGTVKEVTHPA